MRWFAARLALAVAAGLAVIAAIAFGAVRFIGDDQDRELLRWQTQFAIIADGRAAVVDAWIGDQFGAVQRIADNAAVQIYVMGLGSADRTERDPAQQGYLKNLLNFIAQNEGFSDPPPPSRIPANVPSRATSGLFLLAPTGGVLIASDNAPAIDADLARFAASLRPTDRTRIGYATAASGAPVVIVAIPIFAVQGSRTADDHVGYVLGVKRLGEEVFALLRQPGDPSRSAETLLIADEGASVRYLSPRRDGAAALSRQLALSTPNLAAAFAWSQPGGFAEKIDYAGRAVLVTGRRLANAPWGLLYKVDRSEIMGGVESRARTLTISFSLACLLAAAVAVLAWALGASRKTRRLADAYRRSAEQLADSRNFLALLRDEDPSPTFVVARSGKITFANAALAASAGLRIDDILGKSLVQVFGVVVAARVQPAIDEALSTRRAIRKTYAFVDGGRERFVQANHVFIPAADADAAGVLVIEDDVTEVVSARENRRRTQSLVVAVLVSIIDQRDPAAHGHSQRVAQVAGWIAEALNLDTVQSESIGEAATLINLGKALVPLELLTKTTPLTAEEKAVLQAGLDRTYDLLASIEFEGPTLDIVKQCWENWDGSGRPDGRAGEAIQIGARVVRVANAFVAIVSRRAYRAAGTIDDALASLLNEADHKYDRGVVVALMHVFENSDGRAKWRDLSAPSA